MRPVSIAVPTWASGILVTTAVIGMAAVVWALVEQNRTLKEALAERSAGPISGSGAQLVGLAEGDELESIALLGEKGEVTELETVMGENGGVVVVLTTTCPYCVQTLPAWAELHEALDDKGLSFVGLSLHDRESTSRYVRLHEIPYRVWSLANPSDGSTLRIRGVPVTIVYARDRTVASVWNGLLTSSQVAAVVDAIDRSSVDTGTSPGLR